MKFFPHLFLYLDIILIVKTLMLATVFSILIIYLFQIGESTKTEKLCWLFKVHLNESGFSTENFEVLCEGLVSILYFSLVYRNEERSKLATTTYRYFVDACKF